jgi:hypothetical protein
MPGRSGARRPENRVTARSKLPQKKRTGLDLPVNLALNWLRTVSTDQDAPDFSTDARSYEAYISTGLFQTLTSISTDRSNSMNS